MSIYYSPSRKSLVYIEESSSPEFWDQYWESCGRINNSCYIPNSYDLSLVSLTKKYLPRNAKVIEAGCGSGNILLAHREAGYSVYGIDFAPRTVRGLRKAYPSLDITEGDIRKTPYADSSFDAYWSIGVVEHFWDGYSEILEEASRILAPNGYAFISFPYMNYIRRLRASLSAYRCVDQVEMPDSFFQYALPLKSFLAECTLSGFRLLDIKYFSSLSRNLVDIGIGESLAARISGSRRLTSRIMRIPLRILMSGMQINHSALCVLRKV